jgi:subtilisin family serine protease
VHVALRLVSLGTAAVLTAGLAPSASAAVRFRSDRLARPDGPAAPVTRLLVQFRRDTSSARLKQIVQRAGGKLGLRLRLVRAAAVGRRSGVSLEELRSRLRSSDRVQRVEDDTPISIEKSPNDPGVVEQYAIKQKADHDIDAPAAWDTRTSCAKVAVLDTGVQSNHPDLKGNLWENTKDPSNGKDDDHNGVIDDRWGGDLVDGKGSGDDEQGHGTHVAGIIGAKGNNNKGVTGLCWSVKIIAVRVMNSDGYGTWSQGIAGLDYALAAGAKVVNASFGGSSGSEIGREAIQRARSKGVLIVASAGNDGKNDDKTPVFPAAYPDSNILSVAATNSKDKLASFSNFGAKTVDLAAPGEKIASTYWHSDYAYMSGTSMAAPYVAAAAAMLRKAHSSWSVSDISSRLRKKGDALKALKGKTVSGKRLNINGALG